MNYELYRVDELLAFLLIIKFNVQSSMFKVILAQHHIQCHHNEETNGKADGAPVTVLAL